ncbi:hypothetical protein HELRODRAFT_167446 [Helobdella robusta]|uniref:Hcy-binding domain-containing protein n=1 Tax=Helobdella robusta TaxID=6412 RepID=T1EZE1_HELRO|nr:hypothetical protein HELRODRAFT_167446 [Helobdella robusta]ESO10932.1 hypothetical protein HELRODRAFT_167446 [Helobdella robusta]
MADSRSFEEAKVMDGGFSTLLIEEFNHPEINGDPLWGARVILTNPQDIVAAHIRYLEAGADLIETCTYQATVEGFVKHCGVSVTEAEELIEKGVKLCLQSRDKFWATKKKSDEIKVLGSIGPYGAFLSNRSEYSGSYVDTMSIEQLKNWHKLQLEPVCRAGADIIAFETFTTAKEPLAIVQLMKEYPYSKFYISFNFKDDKETWHSDTAEDVVNKILRTQPRKNNLIGLGINCTKPEYVENLLSKMKIEMNKTLRDDVCLIAYPNGGSEWMNDGSWDPSKSTAQWHVNVPKWVTAGAKWIGGCCTTTHHDIAIIKKIIDDMKTGET